MTNHQPPTVERTRKNQLRISLISCTFTNIDTGGIESTSGNTAHQYLSFHTHTLTHRNPWLIIGNDSTTTYRSGWVGEESSLRTEDLSRFGITITSLCVQCRCSLNHPIKVRTLLRTNSKCKMCPASHFQILHHWITLVDQSYQIHMEWIIGVTEWDEFWFYLFSFKKEKIICSCC